MILCYFPVLVFMFILAFFPTVKVKTNAWGFAETASFMNSSIHIIHFCFAGVYVSFEQQF